MSPEGVLLDPSRRNDEASEALLSLAQDSANCSTHEQWEDKGGWEEKKPPVSERERRALLRQGRLRSVKDVCYKEVSHEEEEEDRGPREVLSPQLKRKHEKDAWKTEAEANGHTDGANGGSPSENLEWGGPKGKGWAMKAKRMRTLGAEDVGAAMQDKAGNERSLRKGPQSLPGIKSPLGQSQRGALMKLCITACEVECHCEARDTCTIAELRQLICRNTQGQLKPDMQQLHFNGMALDEMDPNTPLINIGITSGAKIQLHIVPLPPRPTPPPPVPPPMEIIPKSELTPPAARRGGLTGGGTPGASRGTDDTSGPSQRDRTSPQAQERTKLKFAAIQMEVGTPPSASASPRTQSGTPRTPRSQGDSAKQRKNHPFDTAEIETLVKAVVQYGVGSWRRIKEEYFSASDHRSAVDLKDKWRNLVKTAHGGPQKMRVSVPEAVLKEVRSVYARGKAEGSALSPIC